MRNRRMRTTWSSAALLAVVLVLLPGCRNTPPERKDDFFTSGSREADQRASQRMAKEKQLAEGDGPADGGRGPELVQRKTLYERLGAEAGIVAIVEDLTPRVLQDPRVNWQRKGIQRGGLFSKGKDVLWSPTQESVAKLKKHMAQFLALAAGGPARYEGKQMVNAHAGMRITNAEFDAVVGDFKATLDHLKIPDAEQKELLAIVESTRPQIVTER